MRLTDVQKQAIIDDIVKQMQEVIDEPNDHVEEEFEYDEDDWGRCYKHGSHHFSRVLEEICLDGIPGIDSDTSEVGICVEYDGYLTFHDEFEPGDYWTPPSGGIEIDSIELTLQSLAIDITILNQDSGEYEDLDISEGEIEAMKKSISSKIVNRPERRKSSRKKVAV
ncbi:MAG: hypothetical protein K2G90_00760 [Muribaculaceae bacterium]|nr:hypothetical protein [Muribaculaceae bacterium]